VYEQIHVQAPNAKVVVAGYPHLFDVVDGIGCQGFVSDVQTWLNQMADTMTQTITGAISDTKALYPSMNIRFVDVTAGFAGHAVCESSAAEWINGIDLVNQVSSFHPNHNGQAEYGVLVNAAL
jgi:hypothetical protein